MSHTISESHWPDVLQPLRPNESIRQRFEAEAWRDIYAHLRSGNNTLNISATALSVSDHELQNWQPWQAEGVYVKMYKRQTACPSHFARMEVKLRLLERPALEIVICRESEIPGEPSQHAVSAMSLDALWLAPGWILGFVHALQEQQQLGLKITLRNCWVHMIDSTPFSFYICARQLIREANDGSLKPQ